MSEFSNSISEFLEEEEEQEEDDRGGLTTVAHRGVASRPLRGGGGMVKGPLPIASAETPKNETKTPLSTMVISSNVKIFTF